MTKETTDLFEMVKSCSGTELETILHDNPPAADSTNDQGISLLLMAVYSRNKEAIETIKKFKNQLSSWEAVCTGEISELKRQLINDPSLLTMASPDGFSLLGYACFFEQEKIGEFLISEGANVNAASENKMKVTPLHSAVAVSNFNLCRLLLEKGANANAIQQGGYTALHAAAQNGKIAIVKLLLEYGADKNIITSNGESAIDSAKAKSHNETAEFIKNYESNHPI